MLSAPTMTLEPSPWQWVEIFRSPTKKAANEHALVLQARELPHQILFVEGSFLLLVPAAQAARARSELFHYDTENVGWPPREVVPAIHSHGRIAALVYSLVLLALFPMGRFGFLGRDFFTAGALDAERVRGGEVWRAVTALTLHADASHLAGNIVFGSVFAIVAGHQLGAGAAWFAILLAGTLGNLANACLQANGFVSIGASTASFAALGLFAAYEWIRRRTLRFKPMRRLAPLFGAAALLGWLGMPLTQAQVDVVGHLAGFVAGALLGVLLGRSRLPETLTRRTQRILGAATLAVVALAWAAALAV
jgi:membrane associated rhomboid family serine protease